MNTGVPQPGMAFLLLSAVIGVIVGGIIWGILLKLLSGPVGQKSVSWGPAFRTGFIIALVSQAVNLVLSFIHPFLGFLGFPIAFVLAMFAIHKFHGITLGRSALITLIAIVIMFVVMIVLAIVVGVIAAAIGIAASGGATP